MIEAPLGTSSTLVEAVRAIEASRRRIAVVLDGESRLVGTLTDGDVRRCLLAGGTLETPVSQAMNPSPLSAPVESSDSHLLAVMKKGNILAVPLVDAQNRFQRLVHLLDLDPEERRLEASGFDFAVIMVGGEGKRLGQVTRSIPKPMVDIGGSPLLERQISRLSQAGVSKVYLSVNYLSHVIEEHFGDGSRFGIEIRYLRESKKMGTGGALSLLPERPSGPIVVMNGDILTTSNFGSLLSFHAQQKAEVTVAAVDHTVQIPFGVIQSDGPKVTGLAEKPTQRFLCNAGIYAVSPGSLGMVPQDAFFNMTDLIEACLKAGKPVAVFPVHEYWSDIGTPDDLSRARKLFYENDVKV